MIEIVDWREATPEDIAEIKEKEKEKENEDE